LSLGQVQAAILQELPVVSKASQITALGQDGQGDDWAPKQRLAMAA